MTSNLNDLSSATEEKKKIKKLTTIFAYMSRSTIIFISNFINGIFFTYVNNDK